MVTNIRESKTTLELATNAGTRTTKKLAKVPGYGTVWYDKTAIANTNIMTKRTMKILMKILRMINTIESMKMK
jgi:hypothetical protein